MNTGRIVQRVFPCAPPQRLATLRIVVGAFAVVYLVTRNGAYLSLIDADPSRFEPVGVLSPLPRPPPTAIVAGCYALAVASGIGFILGRWFRVCGPAFAVALLVLATYRSSWGQILWQENLMVLHVMIVGCSRSADALCWHRRPSPRLPSRGMPATGSPDLGAGGPSENSEAYGVPVRLAAIVTVLTYVIAGVAKFRFGGVEWMTSDSLRNHVAASVVRADLLGSPASPVGRWLIRLPGLFPPAAVTSVVLELAAPIALLGGRVRSVWVASAWLMHIAIAVLMFVTFPYPLFLVAFAPLFNLEHLAAWLTGRRESKVPPHG